MTDVHDRARTTFWADRWQFASGQINERFQPSLKDLFSDSVQLTLTVILALLFFGAASFSGHAEAYLAAAGATIVAFLFKRMVGMVLFAYYYVKAPPAMWSRNQKRIADLEALFIPSLRLEFSDEDCRAWLRVGEVHPSVGGKRWIRSEGTPEHVLIRCVNRSEGRIDGIEACAALVRFTPPGEDAVAPPRFLDPVQIKSPFDDAYTISLPARGTRHLSVLVRGSDYDPPRVNGHSPTLAYERQFEKPGTYEIKVEAHGPNMSAAKAILVMQIQIQWFSDGMGREHPRYDIVSVRQKED